MKILVINSGSSSIKFKLFDMEQNLVICKGLIEQIGQNNSKVKIENTQSGVCIKRDIAITNHGFGIDMMNYLLFESGSLRSLADIDAVGHRVVQGADVFSSAVLVDNEVIRKIESLIPLAPLHNLANLAGMKETLRVSPQTPNVAVFDTVFYGSLPKSAYMYPLPLEFHEKYKIRKYGAHGTSHDFVSKQAAKALGKNLSELNLITLHIGSGASISAIEAGKCVDTSMGLTPLEGLMMGTRCGNIDPAVVPFLIQNAGLTASEIDTIMNKKSGLLAICGSNDMREIEKRMDAGDERAKLAFDMFIKRVKKYLGGYLALLGKVDGIVFTAGIGENDPRFRAQICKNLELFGLELDEQKNSAESSELRIISKDTSKTAIIVAPTDEELAIALQTKAVVERRK